MGAALQPADAFGMLPRKSFDVEFTLDSDDGEFELYAACFNNVDRQGDIIEPGAFQNLEEFARDGWIALNHDQAALPMGIISEAIQDQKGLKVKGRWHSTQAAQNCRIVVRERMAAGKAVKCSIGYVIPIDGERYEREDGRAVRHISKLSVYEASFVNLPANPAAEVVSVKSQDFDLDGFEEEDLEMAAERGLVEALKGALGIATKGGRKMSGATFEKMKGYAKAMEEHGDKCMTQAKEMHEKVKSLKAMGEAHKEVAGEFHKSLKELVAGGGRVADDEDAEDESAEDEEKDDDEEEDEEVRDDEEEDDEAKAKARKRKRKQDDEERDDEDSQEEKVRKAYRAVLRKRSLVGRGHEACP